MDLITQTNLDIGQETTEVSTGGSGSQYSRTVPQGIYLAEANRYAAFGKVTKFNSFAEEGKQKQTQDRIRFGFELIECIVPIDPKAEDFPLVKEYGEVKEPYVVDINNGLDFNRSEHAKAGFPAIRNSLISALPLSVVEKLEEQDKDVFDVFKSLKQLVGQQFLVYVYEEKDKDGKAIRNHINFSAEKAGAFTKANLAADIKYQVKEGLTIFPIDAGERYSGTKKLPIVEPKQALRTKAIVWDVAAVDMTQAHLDAVAHEYIVVGEECSPTDSMAPEYCQLLKMQMVNGQLQGTVVGRKIEAGELKIPDPRVVQKKDSADKAKVEVDFEDTSEIAEAPFETPKAKPIVAQSAEDVAVEDEASQYDL